MRDRLFLGAYVAAVLAATLIHDTRWLLAGTAALALVAGRDFPRIARRALVAILLFNAIVTASYTAVTALQGGFSAVYVVRTNLRVFLLTGMTFLARERIDPFRLLGPGNPITFFFVVVYGQVVMLLRRLETFRLAFRSRSVVRPSIGDVYRHRAATASSLLERSLHHATEVTQAMRSRGVFVDPD